MGDLQQRNQRFRKSPLQLGIGQYMASVHGISNIALSIMNKSLACGALEFSSTHWDTAEDGSNFASDLGNILLQQLKIFTGTELPNPVKKWPHLPQCMASLCTQKLSEHILNFIKKSIFLARRDDDEHTELPFLSCGGKLPVLQLQTTGDEIMDTGQSWTSVARMWWLKLKIWFKA